MKKRFLLPLLAVALPVQLVAIGGTVSAISNGLTNALPKSAERPATKQELADHANKLQAQRDKLASAGLKPETQQCLKLKAEVNALQPGLGDKSYDCEGVQNYKTPQQRLAAAGGQTKLIRECEASFRPQLKDPDSYRYTSARIVSDSSETMAVTVLYTATNSFGARIQTTQTCNFRV